MTRMPTIGRVRLPSQHRRRTLPTGAAPTRRVLVLLASVAVLISACSASTVSTSSIPAPKGLPAFYSVPKKLPSTVPGTLIKWQKVPSDGLDGTVYRVQYVSEDEGGGAIPVTGLIVVPKGLPPAGGYPVVTWGHGTNGMAEQCAPSLTPSSAVPLANDLLHQGWEVTASDYQGEGTPGPLPYLVGVVAARNTIDIVRAARQLPAAHASANYVIWGHSEGGQTAMFGLDIGTSYAPELHLKGVVAGAPPSQFAAVYGFLKSSPYRFYLFMAGEGYEVAYGKKLAPLSEVVTKKGLSLLPDLEKGCYNYLQSTLDKFTLAEVVKTDPFRVPAWKKLLEANDPESFTTPSTVPLLILQGGNDHQIPVVSTLLLYEHECSIGQDAERWIYPGLSHTGVIPVSAPDMIRWISDRFANGPNPDPYTPIGEAGVQVQRCAGP